MNLTKNLIIYFLALFCLFYQTSKLKAAEYSPLPIKLSLKQAIEETLNNNTSIAVQKYNSKINEQAILEKKADFDTTLDFEFSAGEETRQVAGAFANPVKSRNQNYDWDFSISKKYFPDKAPSGHMNNVFLFFSISLYIISFFIRSNVSFSDKLYFKSKFGDTILT